MRIDNFIGQVHLKAMPQKIDLIDRKIAFLLCKNARLSNTAIAKALKLKREVVSYRIKKMIETKFITGFATRINPRKIGFIVHFFFIKLKTPTNEKEMVEELIKLNEITNLKNIGGKFDFYIEITTKHIEDFNNILKKILDTYGHTIQDYAILNSIGEEHMDVDLILKGNEKERDRLKGLRETKGSSFHTELEKRKTCNTPVKIDELDEKILRALVPNARIGLKDIAKEVNSNFPLVTKRIKRLVEEGVITTFTAFVSLANLEMQMYPVLFHLRNIDENNFIT
ncbi:winged helix-turn-helix transcriptional regulator, partial [Candidatus Woesearchaeota archaeon]|nr:winged helix-turn-helix transcriptional regulator [Candidatus Woesearchaeota archaeon]